MCPSLEFFLVRVFHYRLNTETYFGNLRIQLVYEKIRKRKNSIFTYFSRSFKKPIEKRKTKKEKTLKSK